MTKPKIIESGRILYRAEALEPLSITLVLWDQPAPGGAIIGRGELPQRTNDLAQAEKWARLEGYEIRRPAQYDERTGRIEVSVCKAAEEARQKWVKLNDSEWRLQTAARFAEIAKASGNGGFPYMWNARLPGVQGPKGHIARGSERTLALAKEKAEAALTTKDAK